ncbi:hypothetical protein JSY14_06605 [Brachybacterium sp. EF45031]|uniref:hypothetical protein n=1 Tax=Brachybacterium sillae TaxID=2810536 RepID=UPI00217D4773|nr:hypothetical protein [Brachybacterium sillae]MCS6711705.1 hypothetical protein [Brachybacterium sillae]
MTTDPTRDRSDAADPIEDVADPVVEPGSEGPVGSGVEGADDILEAERAAREDGTDGNLPVGAAQSLPGGGGADDATAAEQGNREGDEMQAEEPALDERGANALSEDLDH